MLTLTKGAPRARQSHGKTREVLIHLAAEAAVMVPLVIGYFLLVMHALDEFMTRLHHENLPLYAAASVGLLVGQSIVLDGVAGRILAWLGQERS